MQEIVLDWKDENKKQLVPQLKVSKISWEQQKKLKKLNTE